MEALEILPYQAQERRVFNNLREYAEDAVLVSDAPPIVKERPLFIEANTKEVDLLHLKKDCVIPVFSRDNELAISHVDFINTVYDATNQYFKGESILEPEIRASHLITGRQPHALNIPTKDLKDSDKTIYYERCAFQIVIPTIHETIEGNPLNLTVAGVMAYNHSNLYGRKKPQIVQLCIGFRNLVCCNLCVFTDGLLSRLEVSNLSDLYKAVLEMFQNYNPARHLHLMQTLGNSYLTESQFCQLLGRMRLYQSLPPRYQKKIPQMLLTDTQINSVCKSYINDENFGSLGNDISMWKFYNLLTGANKSSYIDSFLDRALNATELAVGINEALQGDSKFQWFLN